MKIFKLLRVYLKKYIRLFSLFFFLNVVVSLLTMIVPLLSGSFIDMLLKSPNYAFFLEFIKIFLFINIVILCGTYLNRLIYTKLQSYCAFDLNRDVIKHLHNVEYSFFSDKDPIYLTQRINSDCNNLVIFSITLLQNILSNILSLIVPIIFVCNFSYKLVIVIVAFNLMNLLLVMKFKNEIYMTGYIVKEYTNKYFSFLNTLLIRIKFIKINEYSDNIVTKLKNVFDKVYSKTLKNQIVLNNYFTLSKLINILQTAILFFLGGDLVIKGILSVGNLSVCFSYMSTVNIAINYFLNLSQEFQNIKSSEVRINKLLEVQEEDNGKIEIKNIEEVLIKDLEFRFNENVLYTNLNLNFKQNNIYGIEGSNGSGKTTLIDILTGLYQRKYCGIIKYNGYLQEELDMKSLRKQCMAYCCQQNDFLDGEIYEKIINENTDLLKALNLECSNTFFDSLKKGNLSGGEKQKLNILYCLSKPDATLLLFDEPSSYLDKKSVEEIMLQIEKVKRGKIIIIVSHDKRVLERCDKLISLV